MDVAIRVEQWQLGRPPNILPTTGTFGTAWLSLLLPSRGQALYEDVRSTEVHSKEASAGEGLKAPKIHRSEV